MKILNSTFETDSPLCARDADGIVFKGNKNTRDRSMTLTLTNCGEADTDGCRVERISEKDRTVGIN